MFAICGYNQKNKQKDDITERRLEEADIFLEVLKATEMIKIESRINIIIEKDDLFDD